MKIIKLLFICVLSVVLSGCLKTFHVNTRTIGISLNAGEYGFTLGFEDREMFCTDNGIATTSTTTTVDINGKTVITKNSSYGMKSDDVVVEETEFIIR